MDTNEEGRVLVRVYGVNDADKLLSEYLLESYEDFNCEDGYIVLKDEAGVVHVYNTEAWSEYSITPISDARVT